MSERPIGDLWPEINRLRGALIDKEIAGTADQKEQALLAALQAYAEAHLAPYYAARDEALFNERNANGCD